MASSQSSTPTIILLLGPAGSGKSRFVEVATGQTPSQIVGHSLEPCTTDIRANPCAHPLTDHPVILVDTPGLDDTKFDADILTKITTWLRKSYNVSTIAGIVYLHRISDKRSVGSPQKNTTLFETLCGDIKNVVVATTMWKLIQQPDVGALREDCWRELLQRGPRIMRFHDTFTSAWDIINNVVGSRNYPTAFQATLVDSRLYGGRVVAVSRPRISHRRRAFIHFKRFLSLGNISNINVYDTVKSASAPGSDSDAHSETQSGQKRRRNSTDDSEPSKRQSIALDQTVASPVKPEDLSDDQTVIILMGLSGSGKSSFISAATGYDNGIGHSLESCTLDIKLIKFRSPERKNINFVFVDTPAFNFNTKTDRDVLRSDANRLNAFFGTKVKLAGILYLHRIHEYPTNEVRSDLAVFAELCKRKFCDRQSTEPFKQLLHKNAYKNVVFVTTMWDQVEEEQGSEHEMELQNKHWKGMMNLGATTARFNRTPASAWDIIERCINA